MDASVLGIPGDTYELHQHIINTEELLGDQVAAANTTTSGSGSRSDSSQQDQELDLAYCCSLMDMFNEPLPTITDADIDMVARSRTENRCTLCRKTFKQKSSLVRHVKRCTLEPKLSVRQKACRHCTLAKTRCDLQRPSCSRCTSRRISCAYVRSQAASSSRTTEQLQPTEDLIVASDASTASLEFGDALQGGAGGDFTADLACLDPNITAAAVSDVMPDFSDLEMSTTENGSAAMTPDFFSNVSVSEAGTTSNSNNMTTPPDTASSSTISLPDLPLVSLLDLSNARFDALQGPSSPPPATHVPETWLLELAAQPAVPDPPELVNHSAQTVLRVFRSWPRMLARGIQLPPIIHFLQFREGAPRPLANCITLCKMWAGQAPDSSQIVEDAVRQEVESVLAKYPTFDAPTLLAATQSIVILTLLLLFPSPRQTALSVVPRGLFARLQHMAYHVLSTGTALQDEQIHSAHSHTRHLNCPSWPVWAHLEAKRRAVQALYFLHWAYSVHHRAPHSNCLELGRLLAPGPRFLWQAADERAWRALYVKWLAQWADVGAPGLLQAEFFLVGKGYVMDRRVEMWLDDADELGVMMLSIVNASQRDLSQIPGSTVNSIG
ncbi:hypothetical protein F4810DRAFT_604810 [Camillea tinctor]|nr:hypothetical protein F4810DRAFT_604810 [Camillea tinctor]